MKIDKNIIETIGNTPMVDISNISPNGVKIFAKLESFNPAGSIKDRVAKYLIQDAEEQGKLIDGSTIIEPTSGNTGIALAMISRVKGYKLKVVMPDNVSDERKSVLLSLGAEIIYSDGEQGTNGAIRLAEKIAEENPDYFMPYQYGNEANPRAHYETTGPEIIEQLPDIDVFVAGLGTGGTLMGVGKALKEYNKNIKVVAAAPHPEEVVPALRSIEHGFIPPILDLEKLDSRILVGEEESFYWTKMLMESCGIFAGVSCGAVTAAALKVAKKIKTGNIVIIIADSGERYLSSKLWEMDYKDIKEIGEQKIWW
ncbi:MAG: cysteine synthase family protein [SAR202 cluster bacterium]|nr:cysteine synthase family protein [SAR202 cluster bacterium]|tara:strand:+ start:446 stop:1381 length:936 start_codon:yes stop_codon:yes gene_type:complete